MKRNSIMRRFLPKLTLLTSSPKLWTNRLSIFFINQLMTTFSLPFSAINVKINLRFAITLQGKCWQLQNDICIDMHVHVPVHMYLLILEHFYSHVHSVSVLPMSYECLQYESLNASTISDCRTSTNLFFSSKRKTLALSSVCVCVLQLTLLIYLY